MRRPLLAALAVLATALVAPSAAGAADAPLKLLSDVPYTERSRDLTFQTDAVAKPVPVRVILPVGYDPAAAKRYPVLYLLHGGNGAYTNWSGAALRLAADLPLILVLPEGGKGGWYTNWFNKGREGPPEWETFHIEQLIPYIDAHFKTVGARHGRAIAGLSMGGFGAFSYASRHPDLFAAAASYSGAVDTNTEAKLVTDFIDVVSILDGGRPGSLFGLRKDEEVRWRGHNPWDLAENLRGMSLSLRSGNGEAGGPFGGGGKADFIEPAVHAMSASMDKKLTALGFPHVWDDYGPGGHSFAYWTRDLERDLPRFMAVFADPPPDVPRAVTYTSIEPDYSVFGWRVRLARPKLEFSTLRDATGTGFTLKGSGTATVTTPARYTAGSRRVVRVRVGSRVVRSVRRADRSGRLHLRVALGPANKAQQYTAAASRNRTFTARVTISR